jgi:hypothetical protein
MDPRQEIYKSMVVATQTISDDIRAMKEQIEEIKAGFDALLGLQYKKNENIQRATQKLAVNNGQLNSELTGFITDAQKKQLADNLQRLHSKLSEANEQILQIHAQLPMAQNTFNMDKDDFGLSEGLQQQVSGLNELSNAYKQTHTKLLKELLKTITLLNMDKENLATKAPNHAQSAVDILNKQLDSAYSDLKNLNKQAKEVAAKVTTPKPRF